MIEKQVQLNFKYRETVVFFISETSPVFVHGYMCLQIRHFPETIIHCNMVINRTNSLKLRQNNLKKTIWVACKTWYIDTYVRMYRICETTRLHLYMCV